jgi:hypothetical protein
VASGKARIISLKSITLRESGAYVSEKGRVKPKWGLVAAAVSGAA